MGMNRGPGNQPGWFGNSVDSLNYFASLMDMNSWFVDQIADHATAVWTRLRDLLMWLHRVKRALLNGEYQPDPERPFANEEERREWEQRILRRIYSIGAVAVLFTMVIL